MPGQTVPLRPHNYVSLIRRCCQRSVALPFWIPLILPLLFCLCRTCLAESPAYLEAREKYERKEYLLAMLAAQKAVQEDEKNAHYHHLYGMVLTALKQFTDAGSQLRKAVVLAPQNAEFHYSLAAMLLQEQRETAEQLDTQGLRKGKVRTGTEEEIVQALRRAIELDPNYLKARLHLGRTYYDLDLSDMAEEQFRAVLQKDSRYQWAHYHLAVLHLSRGKIEEAIREYQTETELYPNELQAHLELGELLLKQGHTKAALEHLTAAKKADPTQPDLHFALAKAYRDTGQTQEAIAAGRQCIELNPRLLDAYYLLGQLYRAVGQAEQSRQQMQLFEKLKRELDQPELDYHRSLMKVKD
jgi:tetratricopeptide (TPR) repeat protein